jgi:hypothetical protein
MEIIELLPEINQIHDEELKQKVIAVWENALELGGWSLEELTTLPYTLLVENVEISFPEHVRVVCRLCMAMEEVLIDMYADRYDIDHDVLVAGALLADVGKLIEFKKEDGKYVWSDTYQYLRHPFTGVALSYRFGIPDPVLHVIATHSWEGDKFKRKPESIIFHHADFTDFDLTKTAM